LSYGKITNASIKFIKDNYAYCVVGQFLSNLVWTVNEHLDAQNFAIIGRHGQRPNKITYIERVIEDENLPVLILKSGSEIDASILNLSDKKLKKYQSKNIHITIGLLISFLSNSTKDRVIVVDNPSFGKYTAIVSVKIRNEKIMELGLDNIHDKVEKLSDNILSTTTSSSYASDKYPDAAVQKHLSYLSNIVNERPELNDYIVTGKHPEINGTMILQGIAISKNEPLLVVNMVTCAASSDPNTPITPKTNLNTMLKVINKATDECPIILKYLIVIIHPDTNYFLTISNIKIIDEQHTVELELSFKMHLTN
jgi:hypothetical protein